MSMQVQVAETGPCSRSLTIKLPPPLVDEHLDQMYQSAREQVHVKGFRAGKVPRAIIEKKYGASILAEAKEQLLNRYLGEACRNEEINPIGRVQIDDFDNLEVKRGTELEFVARIDVRPEFDLGDVKGIEVAAFSPEASDEDVDNALKEIAHEKRKIQSTDEPSTDGDFVKADLVFHDESGANIRERKGAQLNTRVPINGSTEEAYGKAITGLKSGDTAEVELTYPDNFEVEAVRGKAGKVELTVHEVQRVTPAPIDDDLAKGLEFDSLAALRTEMQQRIGAEKVRVGKQRQEEQCLEFLLDKHKLELPPSMVEEQKQASLAGMEQRLRESGTPEDGIKQQLEASDGEALADAERRVRMYFLIEAVAQSERLEVTEAEADAELSAIAQANNVTPAQVRQHLEENNRLGELRLALLERKVRDFLRENAKPVDKKDS